MKRLIMVLLFISSMVLFSKEYPLITISAYDGDGYTKEIKVTSDGEIIFITVDGYLYDIEFDINEKTNIHSSVSKFQEWSVIAKNNSIVTAKDISEQQLLASYIITNSSGDYNLCKKVTLSFVFACYMNADKTECYFVIKYPELISEKNEYLTQSLGCLIIPEDEIIKFNDAISDNGIKLAIKKYNDQQAMNDKLFK